MSRNEDLSNLTHSQSSLSLIDQLTSMKNKIERRGDLPYASVQFQLGILSQLCKFPLGRFILERKGANGFWTDYMISHPENGKATGLNIEGKPFCELEDFLLNRCPIIIAHQERWKIFKKLAQEMLKDNMVLASIPCGLMRDLITLDFSTVSNIRLIGVDIDPESLELASKLAEQKGNLNIQLIKADAWQINFDNQVDVITSSGLNVYESDPIRVIALYSKFFAALKPGGALITSVLTYPPGEDRETDWNLEGIQNEDLILNQVLHKDILDIKWRNFRSSSELTKEFEQVGFKDITVYFDKYRIFPTISAKKPG